VIVIVAGVFVWSSVRIIVLNEPLGMNENVCGDVDVVKTIILLQVKRLVLFPNKKGRPKPPL
jgi:hypothetical protein